MRDRKLLRVLAVLFAFTLMAAACGDDDADEAADDPGQVADAGSTDSGEAVDSDAADDSGDAVEADEPEEVSDAGDTGDADDAAEMSDAPPAPSGTFVLAVNQEPQDLAAQGTYKEINAPGLRNVVETLIAVDPDGTTVPVLAESWEVIDDSTIRFTIRDGVSFHDGTALNAESAAFAVNWVWSADNAFTIQEFAGPGEVTASVVDDSTIEVVSSVPDPLLEWRMTLGGITSMEQIENDPAAHFNHPIGTGPYIFDEWAVGQYWTANVNMDWWGWTADDVYGDSLPMFERLEFIFRAEDAVRTATALTGEAQLAMFPSAEECAAGGDGVTCIAGPSDTYLYGRLDHSLFSTPELMDPRVREAAFIAIDVEGLVDLVGLASVPQGQLGAAGQVGFNDSLSAYPYDPDRARALLDEARADGVNVDAVNIEVVGRDTTPRISSIVEAIGGFLSEAGINNTVAVQVPDLFNPRVRIQGYADEAPRQMMQVHVRGNPSGDFGLTLQANYACPSLDDPTGPSRSSVYCNEQFDAGLAAASAMTGQARADALADLVEFVHHEHLIVPLALVDRAYLIDDAYTLRFGVDHRILAVYISPAS